MSNINFEALKGITSTNAKKESIYLLSIFEGKTEKERKSLRKKLRSKRDSVIDAFNQADNNRKKEIKNAWLEFAKTVYKDVNIIFELNTTDDTKNLCTKFLIDLNKIK